MAARPRQAHRELARQVPVAVPAGKRRMHRAGKAQVPHRTPRAMPPNMAAVGAAARALPVLASALPADRRFGAVRAAAPAAGYRPPTRPSATVAPAAERTPWRHGGTQVNTGGGGTAGTGNLTGNGSAGGNGSNGDFYNYGGSGGGGGRPSGGAHGSARQYRRQWRQWRLCRRRRRRRHRHRHRLQRRHGRQWR